MDVSLLLTWQPSRGRIAEQRVMGLVDCGDGTARRFEHKLSSYKAGEHIISVPEKSSVHWWVRSVGQGGRMRDSQVTSVVVAGGAVIPATELHAEVTAGLHRLPTVGSLIPYATFSKELEAVRPAIYADVHAQVAAGPSPEEIKAMVDRTVTQAIGDLQKKLTTDCAAAAAEAAKQVLLSAMKLKKEKGKAADSTDALRELAEAEKQLNAGKGQ